MISQNDTHIRERKVRMQSATQVRLRRTTLPCCFEANLLTLRDSRPLQPEFRLLRTASTILTRDPPASISMMNEHSTPAAGSLSLANPLPSGDDECQLILLDVRLREQRETQSKQRIVHPYPAVMNIPSSSVRLLPEFPIGMTCDESPGIPALKPRCGGRLPSFGQYDTTCSNSNHQNGSESDCRDLFPQHEDSFFATDSLPINLPRFSSTGSLFCKQVNRNDCDSETKSPQHFPPSSNSTDSTPRLIDESNDSDTTLVHKNSSPESSTFEIIKPSAVRPSYPTGSETSNNHDATFGMDLCCMHLSSIY